MNLPLSTADYPAQVGEDSPADQLIAWCMDYFGDRTLGVTTSFGMEGCALIDMIARTSRPLTVVYMDTMFFFKETYALRDRMIERYPHLEFVNRGTTLTPEQQASIHGPELWKRDSDLCCKIRKVDPMREVMKDVDVWITGLRRDQSKARANIRILEWDWQYQVLKFNPLASWSRKQIWEYIQANKVPYNALHEQGYPTVGCTHCTTPVPGSTIGEYSRAGRWVGTEKSECGLHGDGI
ncbi:MAG: phosphoadenylyl-sulfate reductase [Planctomycetes bacterium]|nr:phosphoadenylyl-sulfate reductase [Planctomycetota bacterium]